MESGPSLVVLLLEYAGWALEGIGGILLAWEALFKKTDRDRLKNRIAVIMDDAFKGVEWEQGKETIQAREGADGVKERLVDLMEGRTQTTARWGLLLLLLGLLLHGIAKVSGG